MWKVVKWLAFGLALLILVPEFSFAADKKVKVVLILDQRRGDQGLIDRTVEGVQKAAKDLPGVEVQIVETRDASEYPDTFRTMVREWGADLVITVFEGLTKPGLQAAQENPNVKFAMIFAFLDNPPPNVLAIKYKDSEAYYISGVMAGMRTKTGKVAFTSGLDIPDGREAYNAYVAGAKSIKPSVQTTFAVVGSFEDPAKGKEVGKSLISQGYDVMCGWASKSDWGVAEACKEAGNAYITGLSGVMDLRPKYGKAVIGQNGVDFGLSAYSIIADLVKGTFAGGQVQVRTIATGDVGMHYVPTESDGYTKNQIKKLLQVQDDIRTGKLKVNQ
ncbi:MAG: BMP family ABC transporter substrate-binding protein [Rectinemataceae bacterium]|jgi:basic membrane protein A